MKNTSTLTAAIMLLFTLPSFAQVFRTTKPVIIKGQVYDVVMQVTPAASNDGSKLVSINFNLLTDTGKGSSGFEQSGGYHQVRKVYTVDSNYENKTKVNLVPELSSSTSGPLRSYTRCYIKMRDNEPDVVLSNGLPPEKIDISFAGTESSLFKVDGKDVLPGIKYIQETETNEPEPGAGNAVVTQTQAANIQPQFQFQLAGDIDDQHFPDNLRLRKFLTQNDNFVFKLTKDLYLDMMRFKAIGYEYDRTKVMEFLRLHDLMYMKYDRNEPVLEKKINACIALLREASQQFNNGDIFYKDYPIDVTKVDLNSKPFSLLQPDPGKDDYYGTKRVKGEPDYYYSQNGLNVYLTNWASLSDPGARTTHPGWLASVDDNTPQELMLRIYFLIQPAPAFSKDGDFKGVTAYGLKAVLFRDCPSNYIATIDNRYISRIEDESVRNMYVSASGYLTKTIKQTGNSSTVDASVLYTNNYTALGDWHQLYSQCEEGFTYLSGRVNKVTGDDVVFSMRMLTNYECNIKPGNAVTFSNRFTGNSFSLPLQRANFIQDPSGDGYYNLAVKISQPMFQQLLDAGVNSISLQANEGNSGRISAPIAVDAAGRSLLADVLRGEGQEAVARR